MTTPLLSPLDAIKQWFDELPPSHQEEIARAVLFAAPDIGINELTSGSFEAISRFRTWLSSNVGLPVKRAGKALFPRAVIDAFVIHGKDRSGEETLRDWAEDARAEGHPELARVFEEEIPREPFRGRQWQRSRERWQAIRDEALSDLRI